MIIEDFGTLSNGKECKLYTLQTPALDLSVTDYGTTLVNLIVKDGDKLTSFLVFQMQKIMKLKTIHVSVAM